MDRHLGWESPQDTNIVLKKEIVAVVMVPGPVSLLDIFDNLYLFECHLVFPPLFLSSCQFFLGVKFFVSVSMCLCAHLVLDRVKVILCLSNSINSLICNTTDLVPLAHIMPLICIL